MLRCVPLPCSGRGSRLLCTGCLCMLLVMSHAECDAQVIQPRLLGDFFATAGSSEWRGKVGFLSNIVMRHRDSSITTKECRLLHTKAMEAIRRNPSHEVRLVNTALSKER